MRHDSLTSAGLVLAAACATDPGGADVGRLRAEAEALAGALESPVVTSLWLFGGVLVTLFETEDPTGAGLSIPPTLAGLTLEYDPTSSAYQPSGTAGAPADGVRARLYRVLPNLLPILPLEDIGAVELTPSGGAGLRVAVAGMNGFAIDVRATRSPEGHRGEGMLTAGGVVYDVAFTLPPEATREHSARIRWGVGKQLAVRWSFPGPAEVVTVGWDFSGPDGSVSVAGEYTVRGPDLVIAVEGIPTARYTFQSSHRPVTESLLDRPLTADEEALVSAIEPLQTVTATVVDAVARSVRW